MPERQFCRRQEKNESTLIDNDIKAVIPAEDASAYRAANPVHDGRVVFNAKANEAREDAIIRNTLRASETAGCVLGGAL